MRALVFCLAVIVAAGCGGGGKNGFKGDSGGGGGDVTMPPGDSMLPGPDSPMMVTDAADTGKPPTDTGTGMDTTPPPPKDTGPAPWDGTFKGPLACSTPGSYSASNGGMACGTLLWNLKTGTDSAASAVSLLPTLTTIGALAALPTPGSVPSSRNNTTEKTVYAFKDVNLIFARLEDDGDYHLVMEDGATGATIITEVPFPPCVYSGSPWSCLISRARANVEANVGLSELVLDMGHMHDYAVSVVGVGFWDEDHGQYGSPPNDIELHPVLSICFGVGCNPSTD